MITAPLGLMTDTFEDALGRFGQWPLRRASTRTLQVNLGHLCNMACQHCHMDAGPHRTEIMPAAIADHVIELLAASPGVDTLDLTGGAPELNPSFRHLVRSARALDRHIIDRCNLTVLFEPGQEDLDTFLAEPHVHVVASMPCYLPDNVKRQRGSVAYDQSIAALQRLNGLGYGQPGSPLQLDLVYNPGGPHLPPEQSGLERDYKDRLGADHGITFNSLLTITNMPIHRFAHALERDGAADTYRTLLRDSFNPATVDGLMCRSLISVSWDGRLFDCDFNQVLNLPMPSAPPTVFSLGSLEGFGEEAVATGAHCFGCTAGAGSSCSGALG